MVVHFLSLTYSHCTVSGDSKLHCTSVIVVIILIAKNVDHESPVIEMVQNQSRCGFLEWAFKVVFESDTDVLERFRDPNAISIRKYDFRADDDETSAILGNALRLVIFRAVLERLEGSR